MADVPVTDADREAAQELLAAAFLRGELTKDILAEWRAELRAEGAASEREACAVLCEAQHGVHRLTDAQEAHYNGTRKCAAAIRARGEQGGK